MPEVVVEEAELLVELIGAVRTTGKHAEHDGVAVPHEVAAHRVPAGIQTVQAGGQQQVRRCERTRGDGEDPGTIRSPAVAGAVVAGELGDLSPAGIESHGHGIGLECEPAAEEVRKQARRRVVLRSHCARIAVAPIAADARTRPAPVVDGERQDGWVQRERAGRSGDPLGDGTEGTSHLGIAHAARRLRRICAAHPGHIQRLLGQAVIRLQVLVPNRPASARVADDLGIGVEVRFTIPQHRPAEEHGCAAHARGTPH